MLTPIDLLKSKPTFETVKKMSEYHKFSALHLNLLFGNS